MIRLVILLVAMASMISLASAQEDFDSGPSRQDAVEAGRQALTEAGDLPWYDAQTDQLEPVPLLPQPKLRQSSDWQWQPKPKKSSTSGTPAVGDWWSVLWELLQWLVWIALIVIFAILLYLWWNAIAERSRLNRESGDEETRLRREADLIEQLPFQVKRPLQDLLSEARQAYQQADYRSAIVYLFSYQLVELDRHQHIRLTKGKTNRQYLFELRSVVRLRQILNDTVVAFEDVYFGRYELNRERFEVCWNQLAEFDALAKQGRNMGDGASTAVATGLLALLMLASGCGSAEQLDVRYGRASGSGSQGINGVSVFAGMFEQSGFEVTTWRRLSPKLEREQVLVWAPDRYGPPSAAEVGYLEAWLNEPGRTLIFIGRDYDGTSDYWRDILPRAANEARAEIRNEIARAAGAEARRQQESTLEESCTWFTVEPRSITPAPHRLAGSWAEDVDAQQTRFVVGPNWKLPETDDDSEWAGGLEGIRLLTADDRLVLGGLSRPTWTESQILIVPNGSWLLNSRLVNHEHRRLAQRVIDECGQPDRVCFLESDDQGLEVSDRDTSPPLMLQMFTVYPANILMLHVVFLGILYCFSVFPIFGRPQTLPSGSLSDFGKHVTAVGEMLEKGRDPRYARSLLDQYRDKT